MAKDIKILFYCMFFPYLFPQQSVCLSSVHEDTTSSFVPDLLWSM